MPLPVNSVITHTTQQGHQEAISYLVAFVFQDSATSDRIVKTEVLNKA